MELLKNLKKQREELDKKIETLEYADRAFEEGDEIWSVDHFGTIQHGNWGDYAWIDGAFNQGNIFRTKKEAELEVKRRNLLTRFRAFREEWNDGWKPDWGNCDEYKYYIVYSECAGVQYESTCVLEKFVMFGYFRNHLDCERAIGLFGDEIKSLFVDCEG